MRESVQTSSSSFRRAVRNTEEGINFTPHYTHHATTPLTLRTRLLLLGEVDSLSLEHVKESLGTLENLHVGSLGLLDCLVVFVSCLGLAGEGLVDLGEAVGEDGEVLLDLGLLLLLLQDVLVDLLTFLALTERRRKAGVLFVGVRTARTTHRHTSCTGLPTPRQSPQPPNPPPTLTKSSMHLTSSLL